MSPIQAPAPTSQATRRRSFCSSSPTASRTEQSAGSRLEQAINDLGNAPNGNSSGTNWCTTIKNRGIKIAILYTDYLPVPTDSWCTGHIAPILSDVGPALQACGPFYDAAIGSDLGAALSALFAAVTQSGHLTQ